VAETRQDIACISVLKCMEKYGDACLHVRRMTCVGRICLSTVLIHKQPERSVSGQCTRPNVYLPAHSNQIQDMEIKCRCQEPI